MINYSTYVRIALCGACSAAAIVIMIAVFDGSFFDHEESPGIEDAPTNIISASLSNRLANQPLRFVENQGQAGTDTRFHVQGAGHTVLFFENSIEFRRIESTTERNMVVLEFEGANLTPAIEGVDKLPGVAHFYTGSDPDNWHKNVSTYGAVIYRDLYPGIDMAYIGDEGSLESEFYLSPGADHREIRLNYSDVKSTTIRDDGALVIDTDLGELVEKAPFAYQVINDVRIEIEAQYVLLPEETVGFELGDYDHEHGVVIDPELIFSVTTSGPNASASGVAMDSHGNIILAGDSNLNFPVTDTIAGSNDASFSGLLMKLDGTSGDVIYSALFGGSKTDGFGGLVLDQEGNMYLTGTTGSDDFPIMNAQQDTLAGSSDAFLVILTADAELTYSTYLGGSDLDEGRDVAINGTGNVFVAGITVSSDFPATPGAFQEEYRGGSSFSGDYFVAKYNASGGVDFATYLGGSSPEYQVCGIVANASGQVTITGGTESVDFPVVNAFQGTYGGGGFFDGDITVSRLNSAGDGLIYSTYIGGARGDNCSGIALGPNDDVFVSGVTSSREFPVIGGERSNVFGPTDGVLVMLDNMGQPVYSVRSLKAWVYDEFVGITVDTSNTAYSVLSYDHSDTLAILKKTLDDSLETVFEFAAPRIRIWAAHAAGSLLVLAGDDGGFVNAPKTSSSDWDLFTAVIELGHVEPGSSVPDDTGISSGGHENAGEGGDPVSTFSGEFYMPLAADIVLRGPMNVSFNRYYGAFLARDGRVKSSLGPNWSHNFDSRLNIVSSSEVEIISGRGRVTRFIDDGGKWKQANKTDAVFSLVESGPGFVAADHGGQRVYVFDAIGALTELHDTHGNVLTVSHGANGISDVADGLGRSLSFTYGASGQLEKVSDGTRSVEYSYVDSLLASATDLTGNTTSYQYGDGSPAGMLVSWTEAKGNTPWTNSFDEIDRVSVQTDASGNATRFEYDGPTTTVTNPLNNATVQVHSDGRLLSQTDGGGQTSTLGYDSEGNRNYTSGAGVFPVGLSFTKEGGHIESRTLPDGSGWHVDYSEREYLGVTLYDVAKVTHPDGTSDAFSSDAMGNITSWVDRAGNTWAFEYNDHGKTTSMSTPVSGVFTYTYNPDGTRSTFSDAEGNTTAYGYDAFGRRISTVLANGNSLSRAFDAADRLISETAANGLVTSFEYDANGNLTRIAEGSAVTQFSYNDMDLLIGSVDPAGGVTTIDYDQAGQINSYTDPEGRIMRLEYDGRGLIRSSIDGEGGVWQHAYDAGRRLVSLTDPDGNVQSVTYAESGAIASKITALGNITRYGRDAMGRVMSIEDPIGRETTFDRNELGHLLEITLADGSSATFDVNPIGRFVGVTDAGDASWIRAFDKLGRVVSIMDPLGNEKTFRYDPVGNVVEIVLPELGTVNNTYDALGNLTMSQYPDGLLLDFIYDDQSRLTSYGGKAVTYDANNYILSADGMSYGRNGPGEVTSTTWPAGQTVTFEYDKRGLLISAVDWLGGTTTFSYDGRGYLLSIERPNGSKRIQSLDAEGRIVGFTETRGETLLADVTLQRNAAGKVVSSNRTVPIAPVYEPIDDEFVHNEAGEIDSYDYDPGGRLVDDGNTTYTWDAASRLTAYKQGEGEVSFEYDAFGNMTSRTEGSETASYTWNLTTPVPTPTQVQVRDGPATIFVFTPGGMLLYRVDGVTNQRRHYHFDERGSTLFVTASDGTVRSSYAYDPHGQVVNHDGDGGDFFTFVGKYGVMAEPGTDLYRMGRRFYKSGDRQFISRDPLTSHVDPLLLGPYHYATQNPIGLVDINGEAPGDPDESGGLAELVSGAAEVVSTAGGGTELITSGNAYKGSMQLTTNVTAGGIQKIPGVRTPPKPGGLAGAAWKKAQAAGLEGLSSTDDAARARGLQQAAKKAGDAKQLAKSGRIAGAAGNAATVISAGVAVGSAIGDINEVTANTKGENERSLDRFNRCADKLYAMVKNGEISMAEYRERLAACKENFESQVDDSLRGGFLDTLAEGLDGVKEGLEGMLPFPSDLLPWNLGK